jgi:hypothetical protein
MTARQKMTAGRPSAGRTATTVADLEPDKARINGDIPRELHRRVKMQALIEEVPMTVILSKALNEYLSKYGDK